MTTTTLDTQTVLSATTLLGDNVTNPQGEDLGEIKELMIDPQTGHVAYAVLSFGGFLGLGDKLFAIPFSSLNLEKDKKHFVLDVPKERLKNAPGFDKDDWPNVADRKWGQEIHTYYGVTPYWESTTSRVS
ncbi:MAG TPA: PRC-barrel domain-containing protein [Thermoanaerobaculia bacterium]|nr:PRC-barrel domain-containing protein [Thermoanaerobaculia bacterium]